MGADRSRPADVIYAKFLTRLEPRPARLQPGEATEHGTRMKLLELEGEPLAETSRSLTMPRRTIPVCQCP